MKNYQVGIIGATGMVGMRFLELLENHPYFNVAVLAASKKSANKPYGSLMAKRGQKTLPKYQDMIVYDAIADALTITSLVDFVFCAVDMPKDDVIALEEMYAKYECPVVSNNSALREYLDVPMVIPEVNPHHLAVIDTQKKRLNTKRGFIAVKSNCSIQSYLPALHPLYDLGIKRILVCTYQAISGAGKTFSTYPEIIDNVVPYIKGEEEKTNSEPLKIWGKVQNGKIINNDQIAITSQCLRVPVSDGHLAAVFVELEKKCSLLEIIERWNAFPAINLPSAPQKMLHYFEECDRPQPKLDRTLEKGMALSIGRLREDSQYDFKFVALSHNTIRGAAGGAILLAELLCEEGYI